MAEVGRYQDKTPEEVQSFDEIIDFLEGLRDGKDTLDQFYLGHIPAIQGRYHAKLQSLFTVDLPTGQPAFIDERRIASLSPDFVRALHVRLFTAYASLGFDDHSWFSTEDLDWAVSVGTKEANEKEAELKRAIASGLEVPKATAPNKKSSKKESEAKRKKEFLAGLQAELLRRNVQGEGIAGQGSV